MSEYLQKTLKFISLTIRYLVFVVYSIEYNLKRIYKSLYSVFIYILHNVPTSLELGFVLVYCIFVHHTAGHYKGNLLWLLNNGVDIRFSNVLTKSYYNYFDIPNNTQVIKLHYITFCPRQEGLHISTLVWSNDMKLRLLFPH